MPRDDAPTRALDAAQGFCTLGMWQDAWDELEALEPEERAHPYILLSRLGIFVGLERWESAAVLAESFVAKGLRSDLLHARRRRDPPDEVDRGGG